MRGAGDLLDCYNGTARPHTLGRPRPKTTKALTSDKPAVSEAPIAVDKPAESKDLTDRAKYVDELAVENSKLDAKMKPFAEDVEALGSLRFLRRGRTRFDVDPGFEAQ